MCLLPLPALSRHKWSKGSGEALFAAEDNVADGDDGGCDWATVAADCPFLPALVLHGLGWGFVLPLSV